MAIWRATSSSRPFVCTRNIQARARATGGSAGVALPHAHRVSLFGVAINWGELEYLRHTLTFLILQASQAFCSRVRWSINAQVVEKRVP